MAALTITEAKTHLNISGSTQDAELLAVIAAAEAAIVALVGPLESRTVTRFLDTPTGRVLALPVLPVLSLTSVTPANDAALDVDDLRVDLASGLVRFVGSSGSWSDSEGYTVVYEAGRNPLPGDLRMAALELVRHFWSTQRGPTRRPGAASSDAVANTIPGAAYALPIRVSQLLAPHQTLGFA